MTPSPPLAWQSALSSAPGSTPATMPTSPLDPTALAEGAPAGDDYVVLEAVGDLNASRDTATVTSLGGGQTQVLWYCPSPLVMHVE
jgi:hypothetical protein